MFPKCNSKSQTSHIWRCESLFQVFSHLKKKKKRATLWHTDVKRAQEMWCFCTDLTFSLVCVCVCPCACVSVLRTGGEPEPQRQLVLAEGLHVSWCPARLAWLLRWWAIPGGQDLSPVLNFAISLSLPQIRYFFFFLPQLWNFTVAVVKIIQKQTMQQLQRHSHQSIYNNNQGRCAKRQKCLKTICVILLNEGKGREGDFPTWLLTQNWNIFTSLIIEMQFYTKTFLCK